MTVLKIVMYVSGRLTRKMYTPCIMFFLLMTLGCSVSVPVTQEPTFREITTPLHPGKYRVDQFKQGLAVLYFHEFYRNIDQMPTGEKIAAKGKPGKPLAELNSIFPKDAQIFGSGDSQGVGMYLTGYIRMPTPGKYSFQALTNDGFELYLDGQLLISDPGVHGDRLSEIGTVEVAQRGWFPVNIKYFQRKGSAALILYMKRAEDKDFTVIQPSMYAHLPD